MLESELSKFLRSYKIIKKNPFLNKNFYISAIETDKNFIKYNIGEIEIYFENLTCKIVSNENHIIAAYLALSIEHNEFGFDPESEIFIENNKIIYNKNSNIIDKFKIIENKIQSREFKIIYSKTEDGIDAWNYNKSLLWFIINENHDDNFYLKKTLENSSILLKK